VTLTRDMLARSQGPRARLRDSRSRAGLGGPDVRAGRSRGSSGRSGCRVAEATQAGGLGSGSARPPRRNAGNEGFVPGKYKFKAAQPRAGAARRGRPRARSSAPPGRGAPRAAHRRTQHVRGRWRTLGPAARSSTHHPRAALSRVPTHLMACPRRRALNLCERATSAHGRPGGPGDGWWHGSTRRHRGRRFLGPSVGTGSTCTGRPSRLPQLTPRDRAFAPARPRSSPQGLVMGRGPLRPATSSI
jgi:hypothetical protein